MMPSERADLHLALELDHTCRRRRGVGGERWHCPSASRRARRQKSAARSRCPCSSDGGYNRLVDGIDRSRRVQHARSKVSCRTMAYLCSRRNANQEHRITRAIVRERSTPPTPRRLPRARRASRRGSATREWHSRPGRVRIRTWHATLPEGTFWYVWRATRAHTSTRAVSRLARCVPITDMTGARAARSVWCG